MSFFGGSSATNTTAPVEKDIEMADPPTDSISSMAFSSQADYLAVGSWDNSVGLLRMHTLFEQVTIVFAAGPHI